MARGEHDAGSRTVAQGLDMVIVLWLGNSSQPQKVVSQVFGLAHSLTRPT